MGFFKRSGCQDKVETQLRGKYTYTPEGTFGIASAAYWWGRVAGRRSSGCTQTFRCEPRSFAPFCSPMMDGWWPPGKYFWRKLTLLAVHFRAAGNSPSSWKEGQSWNYGAMDRLHSMCADLSKGHRREEGALGGRLGAKASVVWRSNWQRG